jgi:hypothetical protein
MCMCRCICIYMYVYLENGSFRLFALLHQTENGNGKLPFVCCKPKWKSVFLGRQMINGNRRKLFKRAHLCRIFPLLYTPPLFRLPSVLTQLYCASGTAAVGRRHGRPVLRKIGVGLWCLLRSG